MPEPLNSSAVLSTTLDLFDRSQRTSFSGADFLVLGYRAPEVDETGQPVTNLQGDPSTGAFIEFANVQTLSVSMTRDFAAERVLGTSWVSEYSRGARTVAGTMAFTMFDGDAFRSLEGVRPGTTREDLRWYSPDDIPEFNIVLTATNEYGHTVSGVLLGVAIPNSGITVGVQDVFTEQVCSYVARRFIPFKGTLDMTGNLTDIFRRNPILQNVLSDAYAARELPPILKPIDQQSIKWYNKLASKTGTAVASGISRAAQSAGSILD